jgi:hypothetical protein
VQREGWFAEVRFCAPGDMTISLSFPTFIMMSAAGSGRGPRDWTPRAGPGPEPFGKSATDITGTISLFNRAASTGPAQSARKWTSRGASAHRAGDLEVRSAAAAGSVTPSPPGPGRIRVDSDPA